VRSRRANFGGWLAPAKYLDEAGKAAAPSQPNNPGRDAKVWKKQRERPLGLRIVEWIKRKFPPLRGPLDRFEQRHFGPPPSR